MSACCLAKLRWSFEAFAGRCRAGELALSPRTHSCVSLISCDHVLDCAREHLNDVTGIYIDHLPARSLNRRFRWLTVKRQLPFLAGLHGGMGFLRVLGFHPRAVGVALAVGIIMGVGAIQRSRSVGDCPAVPSMRPELRALFCMQ